MIHIADWNEEFRGKTLEKITPQYKKNEFIPYVQLEFAGGFQYEIHGITDAYFNGCFINILRKAKPVQYVEVFWSSTDQFEVEVWAKHFMLFALSSTLKKPPFSEEHPLRLFRLEQS